MPKITNLHLNLSKLYKENSWLLFFPGHGKGKGQTFVIAPQEA